MLKHHNQTEIQPIGLHERFHWSYATYQLIIKGKRKKIQRIIGDKIKPTNKNSKNPQPCKYNLSWEETSLRNPRIEFHFLTLLCNQIQVREGLFVYLFKHPSLQKFVCSMLLLILHINKPLVCLFWKSNVINTCSFWHVIFNVSLQVGRNRRR